MRGIHLVACSLLAAGSAELEAGQMAQNLPESSSPKLPEAESSPATPPVGALPPVQATPQPMSVALDPNVLPANTPVLVRMNQDLSGKSVEVGTSFDLSVSQDVIHNNMIVIPRGSRAVGEVTWETGKGAFGKSGKMEVAINYVELNGRRIPVIGKFRQEGEGNTVATVATAVLVGVFSAFVTGKSALIPKGRELTVHTIDALPFVGAAALPQAATVPAATPSAAPLPAAVPVPSVAPVPAGAAPSG